MSSNKIGGSLFVAIATVTINYYLFEKGRFDKIEEKMNNKFQEIDRTFLEISKSLNENKRDKHDSLMRIVGSQRNKRLVDNWEKHVLPLLSKQNSGDEKKDELEVLFTWAKNKGSIHNNHYNLLDYYLTYPCTDVVKTNYKQEGCIAIFGVDCVYMNQVNQLLAYSLGSLAYKIKNDLPDSWYRQRDISSVLSIISNYQTLGYHIQNNNHSHPNSKNDCSKECLTKMISWQKLKDMCEDATEQNRECDVLINKHF